MASALYIEALENFKDSSFQHRGTKVRSSCVLASYFRMCFFHLRMSVVSYAVIMYAIRQNLYYL